MHSRDSLLADDGVSIRFQNGFWFVFVFVNIRVEMMAFNILIFHSIHFWIFVKVFCVLNICLLLNLKDIF